MTFIFWQAVDDVNQGHIRADDRLYQLKALQDASRKDEVTVTFQQTELLLQGTCSTHGKDRMIQERTRGKRLF
jgi:hypothetical protein